MSPDPASRSDYLGDGVYAQFMPAENMICLFVERRAREEDEHHGVRIERVCLKPAVFEGLVCFASLCWPEEEATHDPAA